MIYTCDKPFSPFSITTRLRKHSLLANTARFSVETSLDEKLNNGGCNLSGSSLHIHQHSSIRAFMIHVRAPDKLVALASMCNLSILLG